MAKSKRLLSLIVVDTAKQILQHVQHHAESHVTKKLFFFGFAENGLGFAQKSNFQNQGLQNQGFEDPDLFCLREFEHT